MGFVERISADTTTALRDHDELRLSVLRMVSSALHNRAIEKRGAGEGEDLSEEEALAVLRSEAKKRRDAITEFEKGGREDLAEKERKELRILETYLPAELDDEAIRKAVEAAAAELGPVTAKDFGRVIGATMKRVNGQASGNRVSKAVKDFLG